jgi:hypothetical protein
VLRRGQPAQAREFEFVGRHAALRARRGIPLSAFLEAFRAYHNIVWDAVLDVVRDGPGAAGEALDAARTVIRHIDLATTEASSACLEAQQLLLAEGDRVRRDLLEDLLAARPPGTASRLAAARAAGLEGEVRCVLVAALPTVAPEDEGVLRLAANGLATAIRGNGSPLAVTRHGEIVVVGALAPGKRPAFREPLERACRRLATRGVELAVGVSTIQDGVATLGDAYREASLALRRVADAGGVLSLADMSAFEYLTLREDPVAKRLIAPEIERFVIEDREHGGALTRTLLAYAAADLNAKAGELASVADAFAALEHPEAEPWSAEREQLETAIATGRIVEVGAAARRVLWTISRDAARTSRRARRDPDLALALCVAYAVIARLPRTALRSAQRARPVPARSDRRRAFWR